MRRSLNPTGTFVTIAAVLAVTTGCTTESLRTPPLQHVVLVDLADDGDIPAMKAASDAVLPRIATVRGYACGRPVDIGRTNVSNDYDLGIVVQFDSVDAYRAYLVDPLHVRLVEEWKPRWKRAFIVDFSPDAPPAR